MEKRKVSESAFKAFEKTQQYKRAFIDAENEIERNHKTAFSQKATQTIPCITITTITQQKNISFSGTISQSLCQNNTNKLTRSRRKAVFFCLSCEFTNRHPPSSGVSP